VVLAEITVATWNELQDALFGDSWNPDIKRHRSKHAFRGVNNKDFQMLTGLMRLGGPYEKLEAHLLRNFRKYAQPSADANFEPDSIWHWLSVAQHHGLPTRLLDWTYSPFAALHFATCDLDSIDIDGAVWKVDYSGVHAMLPKAQKDSINKHGAHVFTVDMLAETIKTLDQLDGLSSAKDDYAFFFEPPSLDARIVNQFAYFSVLSAPRRSMDDWLKHHPKLWTKIVIPGGDFKWEVRDKLDQSNVTERVLFPGLDGLSAWLSRHYRPRQ
jgi:hypothetical protein